MELLLDNLEQVEALGPETGKESKVPYMYTAAKDDSGRSNPRHNFQPFHHLSHLIFNSRSRKYYFIWVYILCHLWSLLQIRFILPTKSFGRLIKIWD